MKIEKDLLQQLQGITEILKFNSANDYVKWVNFNDIYTNPELIIYFDDSIKKDLLISLPNKMDFKNIHKEDIREWKIYQENYLVKNFLNDKCLFLNDYGNYSLYEKNKRLINKYFGDHNIYLVLTDEEIYFYFNYILIYIGKTDFSIDGFIKVWDSKRPFNIRWVDKNLDIILQYRNEKGEIKPFRRFMIQNLH